MYIYLYIARRHQLLTRPCDMGSFGANGTMTGFALSVLLCMLSLWTDGAISAPLQSSSGRGSGHVINGIPTWTSPCGQDGLGDIPEVKTWSQLQSLLLEIGRHARISSLEAGHKKKLFVSTYFRLYSCICTYTFLLIIIIEIWFSAPKVFIVP